MTRQCFDNIVIEHGSQKFGAEGDRLWKAVDLRQVGRSKQKPEQATTWRGCWIQDV